MILYLMTERSDGWKSTSEHMGTGPFVFPLICSSNLKYIHKRSGDQTNAGQIICTLKIAVDDIHSKEDRDDFGKTKWNGIFGKKEGIS